MSKKGFAHITMHFIISAMLLSYIIFSQVSASRGNLSYAFCESALDVAMLLQWTYGYGGIMPQLQEPFICPEIQNNPPEMPLITEGSANGLPGISYSFVTRAVDPDGDQLKCTFYWGDETEWSTRLINSGDAVSGNHTWNKAGTYKIAAMATDSKGALSEWSKPHNITINTPPNRPDAPSGPILGRPGYAYNYTIASIDADEDRMSYTFDWGDETESNTGLLVSGIQAMVNHSWSNAGTYQIRVSAIDERGASSSWSETKNVIVNNQPDKPSKPSGPGSIYAWAEYAYSSFASDLDGDELECTFDWGDGNMSRTNLSCSGCNASAVHCWSSAGDYMVRAIARDRLNATSNWSENLTVTVKANNKPSKPKELFGPSFGYREINHSYFTMAKDIDGDKVMYSFDWGDEATSLTDLVESGSLESASHAWARAGRYQIRAKATDSKGASSGWMDLMNVTISDNDPPNSPIIPSGPTYGRRMTTYRYATSANDPNGDPVKYVFDWGDKTTSWTGLDFIDSGMNESVSHKWSQPGTYQVKAMALDDKGASSGWSNSLIINISLD